jgi:hypothetical protein
MTRELLPNRREHESFEIGFRGQVFFVGLGRFADGRLAEVFMQNEKIQNDLAHDNRDAFVVLSIALQHGVNPEELRLALSRDESGAPTGIVGCLLDKLAKENEVTG